MMKRFLFRAVLAGLLLIGASTVAELTLRHRFVRVERITGVAEWRPRRGSTGRGAP